MEKYIIALKEMGIKDKNILQILSECSEEEIIRAFDRDDDLILSNIALAECSSVFADKIQTQMAIERAEKILEENHKKSIKTTIYGDERYPKQLMHIPNPPVVLYYKGGDLVKNTQKAISCVGSRKPTRFSLNAINYLIPQWVNENVTIVSGLALGVDRLSHIATLVNSGITIAVLAHGLDSVQPKRNEKLASQILQMGGTLVSEYPVGTKAENFRFINRNRIIVGLAQGTVVFECALNSGTMHSVEFAQEQKRPIFCPALGNIVEDEQTGLEYLINEKIADIIPNGVSYKIPLEKLGMPILNSQMSISEILKCYVQSVLVDLRLTHSYEDVKERLENQYVIPTIENKDLMEETKKIAETVLKQNQGKTTEVINYLISMFS